MRRREAISGTAAFVAFTFGCSDAIAQGSVRRVAIFTPYSDEDAEMAGRIAAFRRALDDLGWPEEKRVIIRQIHAPESAGPLQASVSELLAWKPDVILSATTLLTAEIAKQTQVIPIVFVNVSDPVKSSLVRSLARPGKNVTGFVNIDPSLGGKWAELVHELVPNLRRAVILYNPNTAPYASSYTEPFHSTALQLGFEAGDATVTDEEGIPAVLERLVAEPSGLVVISDSWTTAHRARIRSDAANVRVPVIWPHPFMAKEGGLIAYGLTTTEIYVRAAKYIDRILRGDDPSQLPVQQPNSYELVINLKTAKAIGLNVPFSILARADEVIE